MGLSQDYSTNIKRCEEMNVDIPCVPRQNGQTDHGPSTLWMLSSLKRKAVLIQATVCINPEACAQWHKADRKKNDAWVHSKEGLPGSRLHGAQKAGWWVPAAEGGMGTGSVGAVSVLQNRSSDWKTMLSLKIMLCGSIYSSWDTRVTKMYVDRWMNKKSYMHEWNMIWPWKKIVAFAGIV